MKLIIQRHAEKLPAEWDILACGNPYMQRDFLSFIERTERDYQPEYYLFYDSDILDSCFVAFCNHKFDIAMFTKISFFRKVTLVYLPMSVTRPGIILGKLRKDVLETIRKIKGYKLVLNMEDDDAPGFATGWTCPKCILDIRWKSFEEYMFSLRSDYRNRLKKVFSRSKELKVRLIDNRKEFDDAMYQMYLNVLNHSKTKIETLSLAYFQERFFKIFVAELDGQAVGFVQLLENGKELIFEFVGLDYQYNSKYQVYHRLLNEIIKYGIENHFESIDFGQTADEIKLKLGCRYEYLYAWLHHSNKIVNYLCKKFADKIVYKPIDVNYRVFKEEHK